MGSDSGILGKICSTCSGATSPCFNKKRQWLEGVSGRPLPWYGEMKISQGALATFLGVALGTEPDSQPSWRATAVGDSCLFHTRGSRLLRAFPVSHSAEFGNSPALIGSRTPPGDICHRAVQAKGVTAAGDRLWLMTDALSQWFLQEHEAGRKAWQQMESLLPYFETGRRFAEWIETLRDAKRLRNDVVSRRFALGAGKLFFGNEAYSFGDMEFDAKEPLRMHEIPELAKKLGLLSVRVELRADDAEARVTVEGDADLAAVEERLEKIKKPWGVIVRSLNPARLSDRPFQRLSELLHWNVMVLGDDRKVLREALASPLHQERDRLERVLKAHASESSSPSVDRSDGLRQLREGCREVSFIVYKQGGK